MQISVLEQGKLSITDDYLEKIFILEKWFGMCSFRPISVLRNFTVLLVAVKNAMEHSGEFLAVVEFMNL